MNKEYDNLMKKLRKQVKQKDGTIEKLRKKIEQLEQEKMAIRCRRDMEKEASVAVEHLEKEEQLLMDVEYWKLQAETYKSETKRLNETLIEERQDKDKYKGDAILFRSVLKAVL